MSREHAEKLLAPLEVVKISQGAEAIVYFAKKHPYNASQSCIVKFRPRKPYRYPVLDIQIVKQRTILESRMMVRIFQNSLIEVAKKGNPEEGSWIEKGGVNCPKLYGIDVFNGLIYMENINDPLPDSSSSLLKNYLWFLENKFSESLPIKLTLVNCEELISQRDIENEVLCINSKVKQLLITVGVQLANMHLFDTIHGDLTLSNIVLRYLKGDGLQPEYEPCLIDFGLSFQSSLVEDKAVDLFVLEKALESTHPLFSKRYTPWVLEGYELGYLKKGKRDNAPKVFRTKHSEVMKRLENVRMRGRKRSMVG